jgi:hypothetical protein
MAEQAIEPRQVFAFGQQQRRNAADVELVIDVLDLAYTRPGVTTMVVVSGDGGFGTLVRRLHESGHTVMVCSFAEPTSAALKAVADHYVELGAMLAADGAGIAPAPARQQARDPARPRAQPSQPAAEGRAARVQAVVGRIAPLKNPSREDAAAFVRAAVDKLSADAPCSAWLADGGIPLTEFVKAVRSRIDAFDDAMVGFRSPAYFLRYALRGSAWAIATNQVHPTRLVVARRDDPPPGFAMLEDVGEPAVDQVSRLILQRERLRVPSDAGALLPVVQELCREPPSSEALQELIERLSEALPDLATEDIKFAVLLLRNAEWLRNDDGPDVPVLEARHTLPVERAEPEAILQGIADQVRSVLYARVGDIDEMAVARLLPSHGS